MGGRFRLENSMHPECYTTFKPNALPIEGNGSHGDLCYQKINLPARPPSSLAAISVSTTY